jgi:hypothetical protein
MWKAILVLTVVTACICYRRAVVRLAQRQLKALLKEATSIRINMTEFTTPLKQVIATLLWSHTVTFMIAQACNCLMLWASITHSAYTLTARSTSMAVLSDCSHCIVLYLHVNEHETPLGLSCQ